MLASLGPFHNGNNNENFIVVGLGASAGGVMALKIFFENVPAITGMAYVVILHLSPDHDSKLAEVISASALIPVTQVTTRTKVEPDHVYVIPPNQHLEMADGHIIVSPNIQIEDRRAPVDIFFRTLAESHGPKAVCVVLSGTGANGSMGLKRVKELGGAAFVQSPREADFNEMPRNSISTDLVDAVLPVAEIPNQIIVYKNNLGKNYLPYEADEKTTEPQINLRGLFMELRVRTGHDFSNYKRPTLLRRIERRISLRNVANLESYTSYLQQNSEETHALLKDLLISVTNFFRDRKAFEALEQDILPIIIKNKKAGEQVRIWVAGCATGEEAYSLAMLCLEQTLDLPEPPKIQIFATDIDEDAIAQAREGLYTINDAADVSAERLRRFFSRDGEGYRIRREVRDMVLFANHNFLKDPPFSHLELITCRNVLIYLNRSAQERVMGTFHFALSQNGYLFLGNSESVDSGGNLFEVVNRDQHIFKRRAGTVSTYPIPESIPNLRADQPPNIIIHEKSSQLMGHDSFGELHHHLLEQYAPPSLVINEEYDIVHVSDKAAAYLQFVAGEPSQNLLKVVREELRLDLRSALYQAVKSKMSVEIKDLTVKIENTIETINLIVKPVFRMGSPGRGLILVLFDKIGTATEEKLLLQSSDHSVSVQLEEELIMVKAKLRGINDHQGFQAEELKASNEELQAMNEELRSAAEELETSKEELQSMNEELRAVNQELKVKIEETSTNSNNLQNLINSTSIGTIFLDRRFRISMFTPSVCEIFNLIPADFGRPISDITHRLRYSDLLQDAQMVMEKLAVIEHEVDTIDGRNFIMRLLPYRTSEDHINGIVVTFIDITKRKQVEASLHESQEIYRTVLSSIDEGFCVFEIIFDNHKLCSGVKYVDANEAFFKESGLSPAVIGHATHPNGLGREFADLSQLCAVVLSGEPLRFEFESNAQIQKNWYEAHAMRIGDPEKKQVAVFYNNITDLKYRELNAAFLVDINDDFNAPTTSKEMIEVVVEKMQQHFDVSWVTFEEIDEENNTVVTINNNLTPDGKFTKDKKPFTGYANEAWLNLQREGQLIIVNDVNTDPRTAAAAAEYKKNKVSAVLVAPLARNGRLFFVITLHNNRPCEWRSDQVELIRELAPRIYQRIQRVRAEHELQRSEERLKKAFSIETVGVIFFKRGGQITAANDAFLQMMGYTRDDINKRNFKWQDLTREEFRPNWEEVVEGFLSEERTSPYEKQYVRKDGTWIWALVSVTRVGGDEAVEFIVDISEQKLLQQRKDEFIAIASHELKTPVTSIKVYAEVLKERFEHVNDEYNSELVTKLDNQLNRLARLINDLLDTTKISEGQLQLHLEEFDLNQLIEQCVDDLHRTTTQHRIRFSPASKQMVTADRERISQVLTNLISNAIKYSPGGGEINISLEKLPEGTRVTILDKGIGIPVSLLENVFERFFRVDQSNVQAFPGMGLGLYITAAIIKRHGGTIKVSSKENEGSAFSFVLPYEYNQNA